MEPIGAEESPFISETFLMNCLSTLVRELASWAHLSEDLVAAYGFGCARDQTRLCDVWRFPNADAKDRAISAVAEVQKLHQGGCELRMDNVGVRICGEKAQLECRYSEAEDAFHSGNINAE